MKNAPRNRGMAALKGCATSSCELRSGDGVLARGVAGVDVAAQEHTVEGALFDEAGGLQAVEPSGVEQRDVDGAGLGDRVGDKRAGGVEVGGHHGAELVVAMAGASEAVAAAFDHPGGLWRAGEER